MNTHYLEFQTAQLRYQRPLSELPAPEREQVGQEAKKQWLLEERVLASAEALDCPVDEAAVGQALKTLYARYPDRGAFLADMAANGLDEVQMKTALARQMRVESVLAKVAAGVPAVTEQDAEIFYWQHRERFFQPEARKARHLLVTVNDAAPGSSRAQVLAKVAAFSAEIRQDASRFAALVQRHSECPTALQGGDLGWVPRGHLYPELETVLFGMVDGEAGVVVESPLGFHLLCCDAIRPEAFRTFAEVGASLRERLQARREMAFQRTWLRQLGQH